MMQTEHHEESSTRWVAWMLASLFGGIMLLFGAASIWSGDMEPFLTVCETTGRDLAVAVIAVASADKLQRTNGRSRGVYPE